MSVTSLKYGTLDGFLLVAVDDLRVPSKAGNDGKFLSLSSGSLSWSAAGTGTPGAPDFSVQYNDGAGGFGGDSGFLYDPTTNTATLGIASSEIGFLELCDSASGNTIKLRSGANDLGITFILPTDLGSPGYVLSTNGSNPIISYWQSISSVITDAVIKAPDFDGRNDIMATDDYNPLRILEFTGGQTTNAFEILQFNGASSHSLVAYFDFGARLTLGVPYGSVSGGAAGIEGELRIAHSGGTSGGYVSVKGRGGSNATWTMSLPNDVPAANDYVLVSDTSGLCSWVDVSTLVSTLQYWQENFYNSSPNNVVTATQWIPLDSASDFVATPTSSGAFQFQVADSTSTGGNKRGINAVDFCMTRASADQVASGDYSLQGGISNKTDGAYSVTYGSANENTVDFGYMFGAGNESSGPSYSFIFGDSNSTSATYTSVFGNYGSAYLFGQMVHSSGLISTLADSQGSQLVWRCRTTNNTIREMFLDVDGGSERAVIPAYTVWRFDILISVIQTNGAIRDTFHAFGGIYRNDTVGTATLIKQTVVQDGTSGVVITVSADTGNGSLRLQVTGENSKNYNIAAYGRMSESAGLDP